MKIEQIVKLATEGGWKEGKGKILEGADKDFIHFKKPPEIGFKSSHFWQHTSQALLDPDFHRSLGKKLGWNWLCDKCKKPVLSEDGGCEDDACGGNDNADIEEYLYHWHDLIDLIDKYGFAKGLNKWCDNINN